MADQKILVHYMLKLVLKGPMADCYWGEPERAPHWSVVKVYVVGASRCAWSMNKKSDRKAIQVLHMSERHFVHGV